jgi:hypothetical protein
MKTLFKQKWFKKGFEEYEPDIKVMKNASKYLKNYTVQIHLSLYCNDVQALMPKFFKVLQEISFKNYNINYIEKGGLPYTTDKNEKITKIPTIIFYDKNNREKGRIVESLVIMPTIEGEILQLINY